MKNRKTHFKKTARELTCAALVVVTIVIGALNTFALEESVLDYSDSFRTPLGIDNIWLSPQNANDSRMTKNFPLPSTMFNPSEGGYTSMYNNYSNTQDGAETVMNVYQTISEGRLTTGDYDEFYIENRLSMDIYSYDLTYDDGWMKVILTSPIAVVSLEQIRYLTPTISVAYADNNHMDVYSGGFKATALRPTVQQGYEDGELYDFTPNFEEEEISYGMTLTQNATSRLAEYYVLDYDKLSDYFLPETPVSPELSDYIILTDIEITVSIPNPGGDVPETATDITVEYVDYYSEQEYPIDIGYILRSYDVFPTYEIYPEILSLQDIDLVGWLTGTITNVFNVQIIGNITLGSIMWFVLGVGLLFFLLMAFLGG